EVVDVVEPTGVDSATRDLRGLVNQGRPVEIGGHVAFGVVVDRHQVTVGDFELGGGAAADLSVLPHVAEPGGFDRGDPTIEGFLTRGAVEGASNTVCVRGGELDGVELVFVPAAQVRGISDAGDLLHREQVGEEAQALFEYGSEEFNGTEVRNIEVLI